MGTGLRPSGRWVKRVRTRPIAGALLGLLLAASLPTALAQDDVREDIASRSGVPVTFYGHIFDDVLKLKYLHQRYTNYLRWLVTR